AEAVAAGRNPATVGNVLRPDHVIEVQQTGPVTGSIVWEWHVWDHLVQDFDAGQANYGVVGDHPELVDINFPPGALGPGSMGDWQHTNGIAFNPELDQIVLSAHHFGEAWIIDHSTTTEEAASHAGGASGMGGDLLYRWGNPVAYGHGTQADQMLWGQHDVQWIAGGSPGEGHLLVFNNGGGRPGGPYSSVDEFETPWDAQAGSYLRSPGQ
ncbi:MAG: aryl-sulfate sulfotransferase, partial [Vicinamibacterales bacterium]|nr:aryl-sulfate sulfotransferase [Vicinamibacterales bacterium]